MKDYSLKPSLIKALAFECTKHKIALSPKIKQSDSYKHYLLIDGVLQLVSS